MGPEGAAYGVPVGAPGQAPMGTAAGPMGSMPPGMMYGYPGTCYFRGWVGAINDGHLKH